MIVSLGTITSQTNKQTQRTTQPDARCVRTDILMNLSAQVRRVQSVNPDVPDAQNYCTYG